MTTIINMLKRSIRRAEAIASRYRRDGMERQAHLIERSTEAVRRAVKELDEADSLWMEYLRSFRGTEPHNQGETRDETSTSEDPGT